MMEYIRKSVFFEALFLIHVISTNSMEVRKTDHDVNCDENIIETVRLQKTGIYSAINIQFAGNFYKGKLADNDALHCLANFESPDNYGLLVSIHPIVAHVGLNCSGHVQLFLRNSTKSTKLCSDERRSFISYPSEKGIEILYHFDNRIEYKQEGVSDDYYIMITAFKPGKANLSCGDDEFYCENTCIWNGHTCDGTKNCGDGDDEKLPDCGTVRHGKSKTKSFWKKTFKPYVTKGTSSHRYRKRGKGNYTRGNGAGLSEEAKKVLLATTISGVTLSLLIYGFYKYCRWRSQKTSVADPPPSVNFMTDARSDVGNNEDAKLEFLYPPPPSYFEATSSQK